MIVENLTTVSRIDLVFEHKTSLGRRLTETAFAKQQGWQILHYVQRRRRIAPLKNVKPSLIALLSSSASVISALCLNACFVWYWMPAHIHIGEQSASTVL
jgi:hypothetical protein